MLYVGDCIQILKTLQPIYDTVVTSPPYNIGVEYDVYDDKLTRADYLFWTQNWIRELRRVNTKHFFLNVQDLDVLRIAERYYTLANTIYWVKSISIADQPVIGHNKPMNSKKFLNRCVEPVYHLTAGDQEIDRLAIGVPYADKSNLERFGKEDNRCRGNAWFVPYETKNLTTHPAAYPVKLVEMCYKLAGAKVTLDPFEGSGSSFRAARNLGLQHTGIDISKGYIDGIF